MRSYASLEQLKGVLGGNGGSQDSRLILSLVVATAWVDYHLGLINDHDVWDLDDSGDTLEVVEAPKAAYVLATLAAAIRFHKAPDVPFGVAGMSDGGMVAYVRMSVPEAEIILYGHRSDWGLG